MPGGGPEPAATAVAPQGSPAVVASVGTYSGPAGSVLRPPLEGAQLWVKYINAKGGLHGHAVKLISYDDGADPARHKAQVQEAIEQRGVIAFLANSEVITGGSSTDYLAKKRVPVLGTEGSGDYAYDHPMYFPQMSLGMPFVNSSVFSAARQVVPTGRTKAGTIICTEAPVSCDNLERGWVENAEKVGFQYVYRGRASIAQPDYTAECLSARNAGVETLFIGLDPNSLGRVVTSCARQGYRPQYATMSNVVLDRFKGDPNLDALATFSPVFPYFQSGTPASDAFRQALQAYGQNLEVGVGTAIGWTAGKLLERAATQLDEPPTSEAVLRGLWTVRDDSLGGLTYPLTFVENQPKARKTCWFDITIQKGAWVAVGDSKMTCS